MLVIKEATVKMMSASLNQSDDFHLQPKILRRFRSQWLRDVFTFVLQRMAACENTFFLIILSAS